MHPVFAFFTVLYCAGIFWLSSQPVGIQSSIPHIDKVVHMALYAGLAGVISIGIRRREKPVSPATQVLVPVIAAVVYGVSDEIHQLFVPERTFDLVDIAADGVGAVLAQYGLCRWFWRISWRRIGPSKASGEHL